MPDISAIDEAIEEEIPLCGRDGKFDWDDSWLGLTGPCTRVIEHGYLVALFFGPQRRVRAMRFIALEQ